MKIVVNEMPVRVGKCPYSKWVPNPPFIEEPGYWCCTFNCNNHSECPQCELGLEENQCLWFVQIPPQVNW